MILTIFINTVLFVIALAAVVSHAFQRAHAAEARNRQLIAANDTLKSKLAEARLPRTVNVEVTVGVQVRNEVLVSHELPITSEPSSPQLFATGGAYLQRDCASFNLPIDNTQLRLLG